MHTLECFEFTLGRLSQLRERLMQPDVVYCHESFSSCGMPSCAAGWATTVWPDEIRLTGLGVLTAKGEHDERCGIDILGVGVGSCWYLFGLFWGIELLNERTDMSLPETIRRFDKLIAYYQKRVDTLKREERERLELRRSRKTGRQRSVGVAV